MERNLILQPGDGGGRVGQCLTGQGYWVIDNYGNFVRGTLMARPRKCGTNYGKTETVFEWRERMYPISETGINIPSQLRVSTTSLHPPQSVRR